MTSKIAKQNAVVTTCVHKYKSQIQKVQLQKFKDLLKNGMSTISFEILL